MTVPPRPPIEAAPPPCAPGKAAGALPGVGVAAGVGVGIGVGIGVGMGIGVGVGVDVGAGTGAGQFDTVITGTVPAEEKVTAQPGGARACLGTARLTTPLIVDVVLVCASAGTA